MLKTLLGSTTGLGKTKVNTVAGVIVGDVVLIIVPLLVLGANKVSKNDRDWCLNINLDQVNKSRENTSELKKMLYEYTATRKKIQYFFFHHCILLTTGSCV